jgi:hypothetical protein
MKEEKKKALEELLWPEIFLNWLKEGDFYGEIGDKSI